MEYNIHIITGLSGGGAEHLVLDLASRAQKDSKEVLIISITSFNEILHKFEKHNLKCHFLNIHSFSQIPSGIQELKRILKPFGKNTVVHCHMIHAFTFSLLAKLMGKSLKIIFTLHTNKVDSISRRWFLFISKFFRCTDIIFTQNARKWYLKNSALLPNGINLSKFRCKEYNESDIKLFKFLFLGNLTIQKNPLFIPELIVKLNNKGISNFKIYFIGDGPLRNALVKKIKNLCVDKQVELLGFRNDVPNILADFHCQIMPSIREGMPISILESGAVGLPVLATPVGSIPEFLDDSTGYVSNIENFHIAMIDIITNYSKAVEKSKKFKLRVFSEFDINLIYAKHQEIYQKLYDR